MRINKLEAELILYHIDKEAKFDANNAVLLKVIITEEPQSVYFTPDELWWIIRGVPVEGDFAKIYHEIKVKAAKNLVGHYDLETWRTPVEIEADDKQLEEMFNARQDEGEAQGDTEDQAGQERGTPTRRILSESEDQDSANNRPADTVGCGGCNNLRHPNQFPNGGAIDHDRCNDCTCQEE